MPNAQGGGGGVGGGMGPAVIATALQLIKGGVSVVVKMLD